ncbi:hypothetical protein K737_301240 [Holospora undulata HU1]|uniref:Uncharacterized protein n=1 Tax=Holospora undulata HU1 TaxID=1321371 RepID=A0A061JGU0_9PROT|nr:hypothetical protein K737_301240 [Holospora undulata HU1]
MVKGCVRSDTITGVLSPTLARRAVRFITSTKESTTSGLRVFTVFLKQKTRLRIFPRRVKKRIHFEFDQVGSNGPLNLEDKKALYPVMPR